MVGRRRKRLNDGQTSQQTFTSQGIIYIDNVAASAGEALVKNSGATNTTYTNAASYGLQPNAPDTAFYNKLEGDAISTNSYAIVITGDRGKGDKGILTAIQQHEQDGNICTIMVALKGLYGPNIDIALAALPYQQGFKEIHSYAQRFSRIVLIKNNILMKSLRVQTVLPNKHLMRFRNEHSIKQINYTKKTAIGLILK